MLPLPLWSSCHVHGALLGHSRAPLIEVSKVEGDDQAVYGMGIGCATFGPMVGWLRERLAVRHLVRRKKGSSDIT